MFKTLMVFVPITVLIIAEKCCGVYVPMPVWIGAIYISLGLMMEVIV